MKHKFIASGLVYFVALVVWVVLMLTIGAFALIDFVICAVFLYLGIKNYRQYKKTKTASTD